MMMRRYADAIRTFTNILLYVQRTKTMFQVSTKMVNINMRLLLCSSDQVIPK